MTDCSVLWISTGRRWRRKLFAMAFSIACAALLAAPLRGQVAPDAAMLRYPDVSADKIVFSYAGDLWTVDRAGGLASPLASPPGSEVFPRFSPDGATIAFVGNYEGGTDLYTMPTVGGVPRRVTHHPSSETLCDWSPDGKSLVFSSNGFAGLGRMSQLFSIDPEQPQWKKLPPPYGSNAAISGDGKWLAYTPYSRDTRTWKRYRGGMASDIWLLHLESHESKQITDWEGTDSLPMWFGTTVYYLSDAGAEHRLNVWAYDTESGERRQVTKFDRYDCKWPAIGPGPEGAGEIVVQNGPNLYLAPLDGGPPQAVKVAIPGARPKLRPQWTDVSEFINGADVSPTGKRVAIEARGDIWTAPAEHGTPRNLTRTNGAAERSPSWSPDGRWVAYFSDATGEYELYVTQSDGLGETRQLTDDGECFRYDPVWSPDSKKIAFQDKTSTIWLYDLEAKRLRRIDADPWGQRGGLSWSHDSNWIAYSRAISRQVANTAIWVYACDKDETRQLTSGFYTEDTPTFDRKGDYLYFTSNRAFDSPKYEDLGTTFIYSDTEVVLALPLRAGIEHPLAARNDEEKFETDDDQEEEGDKDGAHEAHEDSDKKPADDADGKGKKKRGKRKRSAKKRKRDPKDKAAPAESKSKDEDDSEADADDKDAEKAVTIEFENADRRIFALPIDQGAFGTMAVNAKNQLIYARRSGRGVQQPPKIQLFDLSSEKKEEQTVVSGAGGFGISADGKKLLLFARGSIHLIDAAPGQKLEKPVSTDGMNTRIDPRQEWRQIFVDAWRIERDFFYDPTMHGVNWKAVRRRYEAMLEDCGSRSDVGFLIGEMISELNVGHAYYRPGPGESRPNDNTGVLGCSFAIENDAWRIGEIFEGAAWDTDARNPLVDAGVQAGDYLLAVNHTPVTTDRSVFAALAGLAGRETTLTVAEDTGGEKNKREVTVRVLRRDASLRFRHWIEQNRKHVEEKTGGRVGYIYVTNTQVPGQNDLIRYLYAQLGKDALIIDERWNGGGQIPTRFIELLNRPVTNYWARRDGQDWTWPPDSHQGPKCMLINGLAGSGGDMFPALFRQAKLGKLIGRRTWGGLVGISGNPSMIDGAGVTAPTFAYYEKDGTWGIEGHGVDPDIDIVDDPAKMVEGGDPQLDAAIDHMLEMLDKAPYQKPPRPAYPQRQGFGIRPEDK